jgi:hypothetical protein
MAPFFKAFFGFVKLLDQIVVDFDVVDPLNLLLFGFIELTVKKKRKNNNYIGQTIHIYCFLLRRYV